MNVSEIIKTLRKESGLTQEQLGKMVFSEGGALTGSAISQYESGKRQTSVELFEAILSVFGYTLELSLVDIVKRDNTINFYKPKSGEKVMQMSNDDKLEYVFVTLSYDVWARILKVDENLLKLIPLSAIREMLSLKIMKMSPLAIKYILDGEHIGFEEGMAYFVQGINDYLGECSNVTKDLLGKAVYFGFDVDAYYGGKGSLNFNLFGFGLFDENGKDLGVSSGDIEGCDYFDVDYDYEVGEYLYHSYLDRIKIKY